MIICYGKSFVRFFEMIHKNCREGVLTLKLMYKLISLLKKLQFSIKRIEMIKVSNSTKFGFEFQVKRVASELRGGRNVEFQNYYWPKISEHRKCLLS